MDGLEGGTPFSSGAKRAGNRGLGRGDLRFGAWLCTVDRLRGGFRHMACASGAWAGSGGFEGSGAPLGTEHRLPPEFDSYGSNPPHAPKFAGDVTRAAFSQTVRADLGFRDWHMPVDCHSVVDPKEPCPRKSRSESCLALDSNQLLYWGSCLVVGRSNIWTFRCCGRDFCGMVCRTRKGSDVKPQCLRKMRR